MESPLELLRFSDRARLPVIHQTAIAECGLACLTMVACYYGFQTDLNTMRRRFPVSLKGATLKGLMETADRLKLTSRALRLDPDQLKDLETPAILHWDMKHFVVLVSVRGKRVTIHDPARGRLDLDMEAVSKYFTGIALELAPAPGFEKRVERRPMRLTDLWSRITGFKMALLQVLVLSLALQIFSLGGPFYMQLVVDEAIVSFDRNLLMVLALGFLLLMLIRVVTEMLRAWVILVFSSLLNIQMAANLFRHLIRLPMSYFENRHIGDTLSRFQSTHQIKDMLTSGLIEALVDGIMSILLVLLLFLYSPKLATVVLIFVALFLLIRIALFRPFRSLTEESIVTAAKEQSNFMETVRGIQTIKLFGKEVERQGIWQNHYADVINKGIRLGKYDIGFSTANNLLSGIENILVVYLGAMLVLEMQSAFTVGMLFAFVSYKSQFTRRAEALIDKVIEFRMLGLHLERIADIAKSPVESTLEHDLDARIELLGGLKMESVSYRYAETEPELIQALSVEILPGEVVAIVGPSGQGKTTLMKLMLGLLQPTDGEIVLDTRLHTGSMDGENSGLLEGDRRLMTMQQVGLRQYRQQIAAVMQEDQLLSGSIAENISFFDTELDMQQVELCAYLSCIHEEVMMMPMGFNSLVGDMGTTLSGGQKQRLLLARALYRKPRILFLDEASSHLDVHNEAQINENLRHLSITRIMIAHREATINMADRVLHLQGGQLHELSMHRTGVKA